jgi:hypothetical protein
MVERLEPLCLMADNIAGFYGPIVTGGPKLAYALPGMRFAVQATLPAGQGYLGLASVTYVQSGGVNPLDAKAHYDTSVGREEHGQYTVTSTWKNPDGSLGVGPMSTQTDLIAYKDAGNYTIDVTAVAWRRQNNQNVKVTLSDQLTVVVQAPGRVDGFGYPARSRGLTLACPASFTSFIDDRRRAVGSIGGRGRQLDCPALGRCDSATQSAATGQERLGPPGVPRA